MDPWEWRERIAGSGEVAYGKFFEKKAGFISKEWLPYFANRYSENPTDSGKAIAKHIMELYPIAGADAIRKLIGSVVAAEVKPKKKKSVVSTESIENNN